MQPVDLEDIISFDDFLKVDIRAGTIVDARLNEKARKPAYVLRLNFGPELGEKTSSAQITDAYSPIELVGLQVIAVTNFEAKRVAGVKSEVLVLAIVQDDGPTVLLSPTMKVENGAKLA